MTKVIPYFMTAVALLTAICTVTAVEHKQMTMITNKSDKVNIYMAGFGTVTIDWGEGTEIETYMLSPSTWADSITSSHTYNHTYSHILNRRRTVTIFGENITHLICDANQLIHLDVSRNTSLTSLSCENNQLTYLDVSNNTALKHFNCSNNKLTNLNVSNNTVLRSLLCTMNKLTELDVSNNTVLINLICVNNHLTKLDVSKNTALAWLYCDSNKFTADALNDLFDILHSNTYFGVNIISIDNNPGTNHCDRSIAVNKGWIFKQ